MKPITRLQIKSARTFGHFNVLTIASQKRQAFAKNNIN